MSAPDQAAAFLTCYSSEGVRSALSCFPTMRRGSGGHTHDVPARKGQLAGRHLKHLTAGVRLLAGKLSIALLVLVICSLSLLSRLREDRLFAQSQMLLTSHIAKEYLLVAVHPFFGCNQSLSFFVAHKSMHCSADSFDALSLLFKILSKIICHGDKTSTEVGAPWLYTYGSHPIALKTARNAGYLSLTPPLSCKPMHWIDTLLRSIGIPWPRDCVFVDTSSTVTRVPNSGIRAVGPAIVNIAESSVLLLCVVNVGIADLVQQMDENQQKNRNHRGNVRPQVLQSQKSRLEIPKFVRKDDGMDVLIKISELRQHFKHNFTGKDEHILGSYEKEGESGKFIPLPSDVTKPTNLSVPRSNGVLPKPPSSLVSTNQVSVNCDDGQSVLTVDTMAFDPRGINYDNAFVLIMGTMIWTRIDILRKKAGEIRVIFGIPEQCQAGFMLEDAGIFDDRGMVMNACGGILKEPPHGRNFIPINHMPSNATESSKAKAQIQFFELKRVVEKCPEGDMGCLNGVLADEPLDIETELVLGFLKHHMLGTPIAFLRKIHLESGLGDAIVGGGMENKLVQPQFNISRKSVVEHDEKRVEDLTVSTRRC
eukprot:Gb_22282 [translate_table: standard]